MIYKQSMHQSVSESFFLFFFFSDLYLYVFRAYCFFSTDLSYFLRWRPLIYSNKDIILAIAREPMGSWVISSSISLNGWVVASYSSS